MCCTTLTVQETTMATTQLMRADCYDVCWPMKEEQDTLRQPLRMRKMLRLPGPKLSQPKAIQVPRLTSLKSATSPPNSDRKRSA